MIAGLEDTRERVDVGVGLPVCDRLIAAHLADVHRHLGSAALGVIDLPSLAPGTVVAAQVRVAAVLYWASELEAAGLIPLVEALAEGVVRGSVLAPLGGAVHPLMAFWRHGEHRFTAPERRALFDRMFGSGDTSPDATLDVPFAALAEALASIGRSRTDEGTGLVEARVNVLARDLGSRLSNRAVGIAAFAARDIVEQVRSVLSLLHHEDLVRALGGGTPWQILARHAPALLGRPVDVTRHVARATAGLALIEWIAGQAAALEGGRVRIARTDPVVREAEAWLAVRGGP